MDNINILVEAKKEYTNQLQKILRPRIYEGFKSIYEDILTLSARELEEKKIQSYSIIKTFQKMLKEIPQWNQDMVNNEYNRIEKLSNCDYFENLIEAVFITNTKILTSVQINNSKSQQIKINIPQPPHFIHKCYMKCAIELYKNPYIFDQSKNLTPKERHNNLREALLLIDNSINNAISDLLPIGDILKQGLTKSNIYDIEKVENINEEEEEEDEEDEEDDEEDEEDEENEENESDEADKEENIKKENEAESIKENNLDENTINIDIIKQNGGEMNNFENMEKEENKINEIEINLLKNEVDENVEENVDENIIDLNIEEFKNEEPEVKLINLEKKDISVKEVINESESIDNKVELKSIVYNKVTPPFASKIKNIIKVNSELLGGDSKAEVKNEVKDLHPKLTKEITIENITQESKPIEIMYNKKNVKNDIVKNNETIKISSNPFLKNLKNNKIIKYKNGGLNKNKAFYQKKYEENSSNYNSLSSNLKENIQTTLDELKHTQDSFKIVKNKIMLNNISSDEEDNGVIELDA